MDDTLYQHRDISWLSFNGRVLQEAEDPRNPLYERLKFLAIFSSNLDEFFRVRVSKLRQIKNVDKELRKKLKLHPTKTLKKIITTVEEQQEKFGRIFNQQLVPELNSNGIQLIHQEYFTPEQKKASGLFFNEYVQDCVKTIPVIEGEIPFLENNQLYFFVCLGDGSFCFVSIPSHTIKRFVELPSQNHGHTITFLDDIIKNELPNILKNKEIQSCFEVKLSRDAELYWEDNFGGDIAEQIEASLVQRKVGQPTRLLYDLYMPKDQQSQLKTILQLGKVDMFPGGKYHNFSDFMSFPDPTENPSLHFESLPPLPHPELYSGSNSFEVIRKKDQMVHFPYQGFDPVIDFLNRAAEDPLVKSIKISLYRIAKDSHLAKMLLRALENQKKVMVFVEPKARFDEANNLDWSKKLKENGAEVFHSDLTIKVHSKIMMVEREEGDKIVRYGYISTGNFNRKTSKIYADHGLFTADSRITGELAQVFDVLSRKRLAPVTKHLLVSPFTTRNAFIQLVDNEIKNAKWGKPASIRIKMNSLQDQTMIDKLYQAAEEGVKIRMLVRGFCCLHMAQVKKHENLIITSIVDRFLEHGRIYWFENNGDPKMYTGSADWMTRNLDRRIEVLTPIYDSDVFNELSQILELQLNDNVKARIVDAQESNSYFSNNKKPCRSQYEIYRFLKEKMSVSTN